MSKLSNLFMFVLGGVIGSGTTYFVLKERMTSEMDIELEQIKNAYNKKYEENDSNIAKEEPKNNIQSTVKEFTNKKPITDYSKIIKEENYKKEEEKEMSPIDGEIIIEPDNHEDEGVIGFGLDPYDTVFATIYSDGYLVDDADHIIDIDMIGGKETLEHFGEGDDPELLHVRNVLYEIDYEIDRDDRTYAEVSGKDVSELPELD